MTVDKPNSYVNGFLRENNFSHRWRVNNKEIKLFLKEESYCSVSENNRVIERIAIPNDVAKNIRKTHQIYIHILETQERFDFCPVLFKTKFEGLKVSILYSRLGPIWQLYDRNTKETRWQRFSATFVSDACHRKTWDMFEKFKKRMQKDIRLFQSFEENFLIKDIVLLKKAETNIPINVDLESIAEEEGKKAWDLKKRKAWEDAGKEMLAISFNNILKTYSHKGVPLKKNNEDPYDLFIFGGTKKHIRFDEKEKRFAIYKTIIRNPTSLILGHKQESQLLEREKEKNKNWIDPAEAIQMLFQTLSFLPLKKHLVVSEKIRPLAESIFPFYVIVEPKTIPCTLDAHVRISKFRWAVTIICSGMGICGQHAELVIQGISDSFIQKMYTPHKPIGEMFTLISHLVGTNTIEIEPVVAEKLRLTERTKVWLLTSKKIKTMLVKMEKEKKAENTKFSPFGSYSPLSGGGHNCFTWAHSYLKEEGIDLGWPAFGFFFTQTNSYTERPEYYIQHPEYQKI